MTYTVFHVLNYSFQLNLYLPLSGHCSDGAQVQVAAAEPTVPPYYNQGREDAGRHQEPDEEAASTLLQSNTQNN